ncbi:hypothetical protein FOA52_015892 [Chlamydomonas sp. UWO 241]|nr:hypothetical protein FOA52_015892 [Chlamydomonas sp. UWO 241]
MKFASKAACMRPQDEELQMVRECTKELEYEGREKGAESLLRFGGFVASVRRIVRLLVDDAGAADGQEEDMRSLLIQLAQDLERGGVDAQIAYTRSGGYAATMALHNNAHHAQVEAVLLAAGRCQLYRAAPKHAHTQSVEAAVSTTYMLAASAASGSAPPLRLRWPPMVLERLLTAVLSGDMSQADDGGNGAVARNALHLLALAALDPAQRQGGLMLASASAAPDLAVACHATILRGRHEQPSSFGGCDSGEDDGASSCAGSSASASLSCLGSFSGAAGRGGVLSCLLDATQMPGFMDAWAPGDALALTRLLHSYSSATRHDRQMLARAAKGRPLQALLQVYRCVSHRGGGGGGGGGPGGAGAQQLGGGGRAPCCEAAHLLLSSMLSVCSLEPGMLRAEAFDARPAGTGAASGGGSRQLLLPTPLLRGLVRCCEDALAHTQACTMPEVGYDGSVKFFMTARAPADPCPCGGSSGPDKGAAAQGATSLLEKCVRLLLAAATSRAAVRELQRAGALDVMGTLSAPLRVHGCPPSLIDAIQSLYASCARHSPAVADELLSAHQSRHFAQHLALTGIAMRSCQPGLVVGALDRLTPLVDSCSGHEFLQLMRPGGVCHTAAQLLTAALAPARGAAAAVPLAAAAHGTDSAPSTTQQACQQACHPWEAAKAAAAAAAAGTAPHPAGPALSGAEACPHARSLKDAARCLLLASLDRARRMACLKPAQVPRAGFLSAVRPREMLALERRLRERIQEQLPCSSAGNWPTARPSEAVVAAAVEQPTGGPQAALVAQQPPAIEHAGASSAVAEPGSAGAESASDAEAAINDILAECMAACDDDDGGSGQEEGLATASAISDADVAARSRPWAPATRAASLPGGCSTVGASSSVSARRMEDSSRLLSLSSDSINDTAGRAAGGGGSLPSRRIRSSAAMPCHAPATCALHGATPATATAASARKAEAEEPAQSSGSFDEDGLCTVWDSAPDSGVRAARTAWRAVPLRELFSWSQTSTELHAWLRLPRGTTKGDVRVEWGPQRLAVRLGWHGRVVDGPLSRRVCAAECTWCLTGRDDSGAFETLHLMLPKDAADGAHFWRSVFEGGEERSHVELLREAVDADEPTVGCDDLDDGARQILDELRERQALVAAGWLDLETSFDDYRLVIGDATL